MDNSIKITYEKVLTIPDVSIKEGFSEDAHCCVLDDTYYHLGCHGVACDDCLFNIKNFRAFSKSQNLQTI